MPEGFQAGTRVFVAGHRGMVGSALIRRLARYHDIDLLTRERGELDLTRQSAVEQFFADEAIDHVYLAAAKVGGISANNSYPAEFIRENLQIEINVIHAAHMAGVKRFLFLGSSCIYPRLSSQPMSEDALLTGSLEPTNEPYAVAKIAGICMCESYHRQYGSDFRSVMPTNLYGPHDNFDLETSHVLPALLQRFHRAAASGDDQVVVWGSGSPRREFLHVDDLAAACDVIMRIDKNDFWAAVPERKSQVNIGCGKDISIAELAGLVAEITGFKGEIIFDPSKPDGAPRKLLDISRIRAMGWSPAISLRDGILQTYHWMRAHHDSIGTGAEQGRDA